MHRIIIKQIQFFVIFLCIYPFMVACEDFHENNGDLGGMWQLTEWKNAEGTTLATNQDGIYYSIHRGIIQYKRFSSGEDIIQNERDYARRYFSLFRHTVDSLIVFDFVSALDETQKVEASSLNEFGIPQDGRFHIDHLDTDKLVLSYEKNTLSFRKY